MTHSGGKPHITGDHGQRYEISYLREDGDRAVFGWSDTIEGANRMRDSIILHPSMLGPQTKDRHPEAQSHD